MSSKSQFFLRFARPYVRRRLAHAFSSVSIFGLAAVEEQLARGPLLLAPNHVSWWDPFLCIALDEQLGGGGHCLMDARNLEKLPFFGWAGALSLGRERPRQGLRDLVGAAATLSGPGRFLIVFPQGRQQPAHWPLAFQRGVEFLAKRTGVPVIPMGVRYDFTAAPRPEVHVSLGPPLSVERNVPFLPGLEAAVRQELGRIDAELARKLDERASESAFHPLVLTSKRGELPVGARSLARLAGSETK